ncbi:hypothetical protein [Amycolatopsis sp. YIM 10]|uniref:hypothetical protein n=1 Tax=Amycolatopsis sp. YIM 10 TaxID=2653857 RepID=UPI0012907B16|nr:hypothetical protein [Amycolatopsis sp. YIM 10]QFU90137.1 hypothetical protein YIM_24800 [Amycolatopsis sp. YIM 10]
MSDFDLDLPPRRELPDSVRDSIRMTLRDGMDQPSRRSWRGPAVAAAAVAGLAAGAIVVTSDLRAPDKTPVAAPSIDETALDRCWAALKAAGKDTTFPSRDTWETLHAVQPRYDPPRVTVLVRVQGKPLVCDTTDTTVTVSDPDAPLNYAPGTSIAAVLALPTGLLAGVSKSSPELRASYTPDIDFPATVSDKAGWGDGMFLWLRAPRSASATYSVGDAPLPAAPPPVLQVVDRPVANVDRTSERGRLLGECLAESDTKVADAEAFQPGVMLTEGATKVLTGRFEDRVVFCAADARQYLVEEMAVPPGTDPGVIHSVRAFVKGINRSADGPSQQVAGGLVPPETVRMEVRRPAGAPPLTPAVAGGTFAVVLPEDLRIDETGDRQDEVIVVLYDAQDRVIQEQSMKFPAG